MKRIQTAILAAFVLASPALAQQNNLDFKLINATGYDIKSVYVSPTTVNTWSDDILGQEVLEDTLSADVTFTGDTSECNADIKVEWNDEGEQPVVWQGLDLCKISEITLKYDHATDVTTAEVK
jgi:hypothetical protein